VDGNANIKKYEPIETTGFSNWKKSENYANRRDLRCLF